MFTVDHPSTYRFSAECRHDDGTLCRGPGADTPALPVSIDDQWVSSFSARFHAGFDSVDRKEYDDNKSDQVPLPAAGECQATQGTDGDCETRLESSTVRTRKGVGEPKVVLDRSVLSEKASRQLTLVQTAHELGVGSTTLKKILRKLDIKNWRVFRNAP